MASSPTIGAGTFVSEEQQAQCPQIWQHAYSALHHRIVAETPPEKQRFLVFDGGSGMSDRQAGRGEGACRKEGGREGGGRRSSASGF